MRVFLSYRRGDVAGHADRLSDELGRSLGRKSVFQDVATIAPGEDFEVAIDSALDDSDVVLAVIGPGWLAASTPHGASRLLEPDDYVRRNSRELWNEVCRLSGARRRGATA